MSDVPPRLLRETLRDQAEPESSSACLDADTVAAWLDGTLSRRDRTTAEAHVSTCARCQAVMAATARTAAPLAARKWWQAPTVRWLVPIAVTSAAALVLWVKVPEQRRAPTPPPSTAAPAVAPPLPQTARSLDRRADSKDEKAPPVAREEPRRESANLKAPDSPAPQPTPAAAPPVASERDAETASPARVSAPTPAARAPISGLAESVGVPFRQLAKESVTALDVFSPNRNIRWRVLPGGAVQRSTDGGAAWQTQSTGAAATLTAGVAPAPTICWLVGPAGIVVLSTDGRTWQRVAFPETVDLVAVRASDGANATVTAADGRTFMTSDGGRTWRLP